MHYPTRRLAPAVLLLLAGCSGLLLRPAGERTGVPVPAGVEVTAGHIDSVTGCMLHYRLYAASGHRDGGRTAHDARELVVLAHGYLRSQERMRRLAATLAATGVRVATLDFCNPRPWAGRHVQNGLDMVTLANALHAARVIYAGFSAGGLAAVIAGRADRDAIGVVTLDLVDARGIGERAARGLDKPLLGLMGEPTNCNAMGNARDVFAATHRARVLHIEGAGHCDFEAPTDGLCELICNDPDADAQRPSAPTLRERIIVDATLAIRSLLDDDPSAWPETGPRMALGLDRNRR